MKRLKISLVAFLLFFLFIPMAFSRGQGGGDRERPDPPSRTTRPSSRRIDPSEPIRVVDNRRNSQGLANVVPVRNGTVEEVGWQVPDDHNDGMGYRIRINTGDGHRDNYGHLSPGSSPAVGTSVIAGETIIGTMANPTNGESTNPHVHVGRQNRATGLTIDPGTASPFLGESTITSGYQQVDSGLRGGNPHPGVDHIPNGW